MMEWMSKLAETDLKVRVHTNPYPISSQHHGQDGGWSRAQCATTGDKIVLEKPLNSPWKKGLI